jgi:ABC-type dipeptide/oligopeptide/nickel transport system permease subunit
MNDGTLGTVATPATGVPRPGLRERWARDPPGLTFWGGAILLAFYLGVGLSALLEFRGSLGQLSRNPAWAPPFSPLGPSWSHPFGVLPGFGVDIFRALWQATPWDLAIVAGVLAIDASLGIVLGAVAGLHEGGAVDAAVVFVGDSLGSIPSFLLVVLAFAGFATVAPGDTGLPVFVAIFGLILWPTMARTVRERARAVANEPFIDAARASGASSRYVFLRHIVPNSLGPVLAQIPLDVAPIFFVLSAFPWFYNCVGPTPPDSGVFYHVPVLPPFSPLPSVSFPEWGYLLGFGTCIGLTPAGIFDYWWMYLFPLLAIVGLGFAIGLFCDGLDRRRQADR